MPFQYAFFGYLNTFKYFISKNMYHPIYICEFIIKYIFIILNQYIDINKYVLTLCLKG